MLLWRDINIFKSIQWMDAFDIMLSYITSCFVIIFNTSVYVQQWSTTHAFWSLDPGCMVLIVVYMPKYMWSKDIYLFNAFKRKLIILLNKRNLSEFSFLYRVDMFSYIFVFLFTNFLLLLLIISTIFVSHRIDLLILTLYASPSISQIRIIFSLN